MSNIKKKILLILCLTLLIPLLIYPKTNAIDLSKIKNLIKSTAKIITNIGNSIISGGSSSGSGSSNSSGISLFNKKIQLNIKGPDEIYLYDDTQKVTAEVISKDTSNITLNYTSSNTKVAKVDNTGKITTVAPGSVTITVTATRGSETVTNTKAITIKTKLLGSLGAQNITETSKKITETTNPFLKVSNGAWSLKFNGYSETTTLKSNGTSYANGAVALYTIQGIRGKSPKKDYLTSSTDKNKTYFVSGVGTNFNIIGYKYAPNYSNYKSFLQAIYNEIVAGYPVAIKVYNSANQEIYVVGYAVKGTGVRTSGKLTANDIYVIDTSAGAWKLLSDFREFKTSGKYVLGIHDPNAENKTSEKYWWPIGGATTTTVDGKKFATGAPTTTGQSRGFKSDHSGIDIADVDCNGDYIIASKSGKVVFAGVFTYDPQWGSGYGTYVIIEHNDGLVTYYAHMQAGSLKVKTGDKVQQGQVIGLLGSTGNSTGPHLHFEMRKASTYKRYEIDPKNYVNASKPRQ